MSKPIIRGPRGWPFLALLLVASALPVVVAQIGNARYCDIEARLCASTDSSGIGLWGLDYGLPEQPGLDGLHPNPLPPGFVRPEPSPGTTESLVQYGWVYTGWFIPGDHMAWVELTNAGTGLWCCPPVDPWYEEGYYY